MGMSTGGSREINVTPLIDVLLVLLIIFLVMMPIMIRMEPVVLPPHSEEAVTEGPTLELKLHADATVSIDDGPPMARSEAVARLRPQIGAARAVFVDSADGAPWGEVIAMVDTVRGVANDLQRRELPVAVRLHNR
ncbi:MAG TPA: biopolymer transporter ExbD [Kofleriaceae bacterium]|jgi:biopolymer transport protein ExbD|nr:biopolymer transporter ExbD [Kofleriaceae bacterium]